MLQNDKTPKNFNTKGLQAAIESSEDIFMEGINQSGVGEMGVVGVWSPNPIS